MDTRVDPRTTSTKIANASLGTFQAKGLTPLLRESEQEGPSIAASLKPLQLLTKHQLWAQ